MAHDELKRRSHAGKYGLEGAVMGGGATEKLTKAAKRKKKKYKGRPGVGGIQTKSKEELEKYGI